MNPLLTRVLTRAAQNNEGFRERATAAQQRLLGLPTTNRSRLSYAALGNILGTGTNLTRDRWNANRPPPPVGGPTPLPPASRTAPAQMHQPLQTPLGLSPLGGPLPGPGIWGPGPAVASSPAPRQGSDGWQGAPSPGPVPTPEAPAAPKWSESGAAFAAPAAPGRRSPGWRSPWLG